MDIELEEAMDSGYQTEQTVMPESAEPESIADIVDGVYEQCWKEFYEWEPEYCNKRLKDLHESQPVQDWFGDWGATEDWDPNDIIPSEPIYQMNQPVTIEISSAFIGIQHNGSSEQTTNMAPKVKITTMFPSVPAYEFCMYSNQNIPSYSSHEDRAPETEDDDTQSQNRQVQDTEDNQDESDQHLRNGGAPLEKWRLWIYFCPYTDQDSALEESFRRGIIEGQVCEWEEPKVWNNDVLVVIMESVRRLRKQSISLAEMDQASVFPHTVLAFNEEPGIPKLWSTREPLIVPMWEEYRVSDDLAIQNEFRQVQNDVGETWEEVLLLWCPICLEVECAAHVRGNFEVVRNEPTPAKLPSRVPKPTRPCHMSDCTLNQQEIKHYEWDSQKVAWLRLLLETKGLITWTIPCDVAKWIGEPCWQTYHEMKRILDSSGVNDHNEVDIGGAITHPKPPELKKWEPYSPCAHVGLCYSCSCAQADHWCRSSCQCPPNCIRRRRCKCKGPCIFSKDCNCRKHNRECEPGHCTGCSPGKLGTSCTNNNIQQGMKRRTVVKRAHHGWGLFAAENLGKGDYIMTYTGEMYHIHHTTTPRFLMAKYIGRNYNFELSNLIELDASSVGNESRFINDHRDKTNHNCLVKRL
ncbi:hypothetical protein CPB86DRAFT_789254 [Serendipita vermifera]|nr:hypothetical protein CPB86DRAFT_789254 [Serendipita vermifera]